MLRHPPHDNATSNVLAWSPTAANVESALEEEAGADADEPPDMRLAHYKMSPDFRRKTAVSRPKENHASLLTRALQSASEGETTGVTNCQSTSSYRRRRSITSDISVASTADLTSDTGLSTPARTNSPSPRLRSIGFVPLSLDKDTGAPVQILGSLPKRTISAYPLNHNRTSPRPTTPTMASKDSAVHTIEKKRCISFACTAKPKEGVAKAPTPVAAAPAQAQASQPTQPRKPCIRFACTAEPSRPAPETPPQNEGLGISKNAEESGSVSTVVSASSTIRKARSPTPRRARPMTPKRFPPSPAPIRKRKYLTASSDELQGEVCHFHEFASDHPQQEDWIREEANVRKSKLTLNDVLKKENDIRRLGKEAEEEAELEEEEEDDAEDQAEDVDEDGDNADDDDDELDQEYDDEDDQSGYGSDDDFSDGYNTDEDLAFADSDEEEEDDGLLLWTLTTTRSAEGNLTDATPIFRPWSLGALSDSSDYSRRALRHKRSRQRSIPRAVTPELPDSTDFVCGTMDEDRPLEEAYMTRLAARKQENLRVIPQDIDPSFPTSEPEDDDDEVGSHHTRDSGEPLWLHGELEELDDERSDRRRRKSPSPKRLRSPPPAKRYHSPPPKARGRSPRRVLNHSLPKRVKSPAPMQRTKSPAPSPSRANKVTGFKNMAAPTGVTHTKSLPRAAYFPAHLKHGKRCRGNATARNNGHVRGAIDIVKGLEQKRQRRKEKFHQKYCDRARKGQIPEKRAKAGEGVERMRELAGKMGQGNYVISI